MRPAPPRPGCSTARLRGAKLRGAKLRGAKLRGAKAQPRRNGATARRREAPERRLTPRPSTRTR
ncbi:pentapeptide repeat-containing protein [Leucobacter sp. L43]|uniref:pentapeptide repeat-containing protein n=1 Tax=Leucobacter sp. L43 TaxID=2798040 RepID=UPI00351C135B